MSRFTSRFYLYLAGAVIFLACGILLVSWSERRQLADYRARQRQARVAASDREKDPLKALTACLQLDPGDPPVGVRVMRRRWQLALKLYHQLSSTSAGQKEETASPVTPAATPAVNPENDQKLDQLLFELEKSGQQLRGSRPEPGPEIAWRVENLLGAGYLMRALLVLDRGGEVKECQALLHQAIACFKKAISQVDRLPGNSNFANIPRWNLELLLASDQLARMALADANSEQRYDLRRNLTILLPGSSGYLSGEPPDNRVLK
jgi:hypothetical protein